ncbi:MAG: hypothetical protein GXO36_05920 [Chloroflexi bacterium]|nr:hypothetical protein [Chloroflexota bacterium]
MDILRSFEDMETWVERIAQRVPGYAGYKAREKRREADKLLREKIAQRLREQVQRLTELQQQLLRTGGLRWLDDLETAVVRIQAAADKIRNAAYGYAGLFDAVKINQAQLERLYRFDLDLLEHVDRIAQAIDALQAAIGTPDLGAAIAEVQRRAQELLTTFRHREDVLLHVEPESEATEAQPETPLATETSDEAPDALGTQAEAEPEEGRDAPEASEPEADADEGQDETGASGWFDV